MRIRNFYKSALLIPVLLSCFPAYTQSPVNKPSENLVFTGVRLKITPPPATANLNQELEKVRKKTRARNEKDLMAIRYWNAGPPSYRWNEIGYRLTGPELFTKPGGGVFWRSPMAWMNAAIHDATSIVMDQQAGHKKKRPFEMDESIVVPVEITPGYSYPCVHAATASAAALVLAHFFPEHRDSLLKLAQEAADSRVTAGVQFPNDIKEGWRIGEEVAKMVIILSEAHAKPAAGKKPDFSPDATLWNGEHAVGYPAVFFKPLLLQAGDQFRLPPPPAFDSEMDQMRNFKQDFYSTLLAYKWAGYSGLDIWTDIASRKIFEYRLENDPLKCAAIYTLLHIALHDATISIMDAKYAYRGIRPDQFDSNFKPLLGFTPPFPGYPSGHAAASATAAGILGYFFPDDQQYFRSVARECADSRFFGGIHFPTDNEAGLELGENLSAYFINAWENNLPKKN